MSTALSPLTLELDNPPPGPHVLADAKFVATLAEVETRIATLKIETPADAQVAADMQTRLTAANKALEATRMSLIRPALDWQNKINASAKPVAARIEAATRSLRVALADFDTRQRRAAEEAERKRQQELRDLEVKRQQEAKEAADRAAKIAKDAADAEAARLAKLSAEQKEQEDEVSFMEEAPPAEDLPPPEKTETEQKIEAIKYAPAIPTAAPAGIAFRETLRMEIVDVKLLPEPFVIRSANEKGIRATFCTGWRAGAPMPECPGVRFTVEKIAVATGRSAF